MDLKSFREDKLKMNQADIASLIGEEQSNDAWLHRFGVTARDTGNAMTDEEILNWSGSSPQYLSGAFQSIWSTLLLWGKSQSSSVGLVSVMPPKTPRNREGECLS
jgi:hypothetical protein